MRKEYFVVTNQTIMNEIKRSKYFKVNLGFSITLEKNEERVLNDQDKFAISYNYQYKTTILAKGSIGNIKFYVDYGILEDHLAFYYDLEEFVFDLDKDFIKENGLDAFLGRCLRLVDEGYEKIKKDQKEKEELKDLKVGTPDKLKLNPGAVTYEDLQAYIKSKRMI